MRFWDSSAVVPLLLPEYSSDALVTLYEDDRVMAAWWVTRVECVSAIERLGRFQSHPPLEVRAEGHRRLRELSASWHEVQPVAEVRERALDLLAKHDLRAADALQLSAAVTATNRYGPIEFVCRDERLSEAANGEGFRVLRPR